jgi:uncharacterized phage protein (TIGR01671 family)
MDREIKFKFWLGHTKKMTYEHSLIEISHAAWDFTENITPLQFTGLQDKNNKDIYEGDIVKYAEKKKICSHCADKEISSDLTYMSTKFCPNCGEEVTSEDFISIRKVEFTKGGFAYCSEPENGYYQTWSTYIAEIYIAWVEVIGNIYENPELINQK